VDWQVTTGNRRTHQMALALGKSQEELEKMLKLSWKDFEAVSKIDINSKTFEVTSKICSTKWG
jgi:hypothetical protein